MQSNATTFLKPRIIDVQNVSPARHAKVVMERSSGATATRWNNAAPHPALFDARLCADRSEISGVLHGVLCMLEGVQEDVVDILLNLKGLVMKLQQPHEVLLKLEKSHARPVTGADGH